jgi:HK97 family phage major capsid protein
LGAGDKLQKAITTTTLDGGGRLNQEQANAFIDLTVDSSTLLKMCRVLRRNNPKGEFDKLEFGDVVTEGADELEDTGNVFEPTHSKVEYSTKKLRSAIDISRESLEENIEGTGYRTTVMTSIGKRIGTDLELLAIQGDEEQYAAVATRRGRLLKRNDGWFKLGLDGHTVDVQGGNVSKTVFSKMIRALPVQFKQNRAALRFFCSPSIVQDYRDQLANRETTLGDNSLTGAAPLTVFGVPIVEIPLIPEDLNSLNESESWGDASFIWLTYPMNFVHVITRDIEVYFEFKPRKDGWESTTYTRTDDILENVNALVTGYNVRVAGAS